MEDWMKSCRYCRFFKEDCCTKDSFEIELDNNIETIIDDGLITEAIREGFSEKIFLTVSKNKMKAFAEELEETKEEWIEEISEQVCRMLRNNLSTEYAVILKDNRDFCCNQWD